ncbi:MULTISPECIES: STM4015 family protein [Nostocales]|uniref:HEAT repeat domain-containing protein n=3 Tax=Nostocales TaxID=1161 RepID=A0A0C1R0I6_9CYAN|nr:STM4015 family protein [Tolypothrix bouteillei]KAF3884874.1 HEAT repeat domain-containing protein [Tolypothrix bouteillei VB521301]
MPDNHKQPKKDDAVLGGQSPPPVEGAVLGGIEGVKRRLWNPVVDVRRAAVEEALNYGDAGLDVVIQALKDEAKQVQRFAYRLLRPREEQKVKLALQQYTPWDLVERLAQYPGYQGMHATRFANRQVADFDPNVGITDPIGTAYAIRWTYDPEEYAIAKLASLLEDPKAKQLEALVFGMWSEEVYSESPPSIVNALVNAKNQLPNLKAVFIGDIPSDECEISWIKQTDISPILRAYPQLEILQVRGGDGLEFCPPVRHDRLRALIVETGGLSRTTVAQICNLKLPALEHLELWFGSEDYGGDCWVENLSPILDDLVFPNLTYLGLRNSQFSDEMVHAIVRSPLMNSISVLDLSMGTLSDEGAEVLLNSPVVNELDILNVSENFLSDETIERLSQIEVQAIANKQKEEDEDDYISSRYCSVSE